MISIYNGPKYICDICGQMYYQNNTKLNWKNQIVCFHCFEPKHPILDPLPVVIDQIAVENARPRKPAIYLEVEGRSVWNQFYINSQGTLDADLTWDNWAETWDGQHDPDNYISN